MLNVGDRMSADRREQAEGFGKNFRNVHEIAAERLDAEKVNAARTRMVDRYGTTDPIRIFGETTVFDRYEADLDVRITIGEVNEIFDKLNNKCSAGWDRIPNKLLKRTGSVFRKTLTILLNQLYNLGHTPRNWKFALVTPLLKAGKAANDIKNYRPISLLSNLAKVWERCLLTRLDAFYEEKQIVPSTQYGFSKGLSTSHALSVFGSKVAKSLSQKQTALVVLLDVEKAYDSVDVSLLMDKLTRWGIPSNLGRCLWNYLTDRFFAVRMDGVTSSIHEAVVGLPQGAALAPALFKAFVADIPASNNPAVSIVQFADDVAVIATGRPAMANHLMNEYLEKVAKFYFDNGLCCNTAKSQTLMVTGTLNRLDHAARRESKSIVVRMNGAQIPTVDSVRYLGVTINKKYSFVEHVATISRKMSSITGMMGGLLKRKDHLGTAVKTIFYKTAIRSCASYGFALWSGISSHQMEVVRRAERRFLRWSRKDRGRQPGSYRFINSSIVYREAKTPRIDAWMIQNYLKSFTKMSCSDNPNIRGLFDGHVHLAQDKYKRPEYLYFENESSPLFNNVGHVSFYNRRIRDGAVIYPTAQ